MAGDKVENDWIGNVSFLVEEVKLSERRNLLCRSSPQSPPPLSTPFCFFVRERRFPDLAWDTTWLCSLWKQKRELFVKEMSTGVYQTSVVKRRHLPVQFSRSKHKLHSLSCQRMALFQNEMMYRISTKQPPRFLLLRRSRGWECTTRYKKFVLAIPTQIVSRILTH